MGKVNILVIDDDEDIREAIIVELDDESYEISEAANGKEALKMLTTAQFDYIITDLIMPEEDGLELIPKVRERYPNIEIIAVSGGSRYGQGAYLKMASAFGAVKTIQKPFKTGVISNTVKELIEKKS